MCVGPFEPPRLKFFKGFSKSHKSKRTRYARKSLTKHRPTPLKKQKEKVQCAATPSSRLILPVELSEKSPEDVHATGKAR